jgi:uncharacterized protein
MNDMSVKTLVDKKLRVLPRESKSIRLKDGTRLDADVYRPDHPGSFPVLLQRQAYGRQIACTICYAHPSWYAAHGYVVVVQDVRGRGTSEGIFRPGETELDDGAEAVEWAARLEGSNGAVGMFGFSYQAYNQMLAAAGSCPSLKAIAPAMGPWDAARTWAYENGAMRMKQMIGWGIQITAEGARRAGDDEAYGALMAASTNLPLGGPIAAMPALLRKYRSYSHVMDWLETPSDSPYWSQISPAAHAARVAERRLPALFIGGWFDTHLTSTVEAYRTLSHNANPLSRLIIGPWTHFPWVSTVGQVDFGPDANRDMDAEHIRFFDAAMKGKGGSGNDSPIELFDMGSKSWRKFASLPIDCEEFYLSGSGRASIDPLDGELSKEPARIDGHEYIVHDPWRAAPVAGGCYGVPNGPVDRRITDERGDVATFTTAPFVDQTFLAGEPDIELSVSCDRPSFDLSCTLSRITEDCKVLQIANGYAHFRSAPTGTCKLKLTATCVTLFKGERLRISIAASDFPAHPVNPGTGEDPVSTPKTRAVITTITIAHGPLGRSVLRLPIAEAYQSGFTGAPS